MSQDSLISLCLHQISGMYWIYMNIWWNMFIHPLSQGPIKCPMTHLFQQHSLGYQALQAPFSCTGPDPKLSLTYYGASLQNWELMEDFNTSPKGQPINSLWCRIKWRITIELKVVVGNYSQPCRLHLLFFPASARRRPEKSQPGQPGQLRSWPMAAHPRHGRSASVVGRRFEPFKADRGQASQADVAKKCQRNGYRWIT